MAVARTGPFQFMSGGSMELPVGLRRVLDVLLSVVLIVSIGWTFFSLYKIFRHNVNSTPMSEAVVQSNFDLPKLSPASFEEYPQLKRSLAILSDSLNQAVRLSIVFQSDSTYFYELTGISDCGCPSEKQDRYAITRTAIDPVTGITLMTIKEDNLSFERLNRYFGGHAQIRGIK